MREPMPHAKLFDIGEAILAEHYQRCERLAADPYCRQSLDVTVDQLFDEHLPAGHLPIELAALTAYVEAALGHRRLKRKRILVWMGEDGRIRYRPPPWIGDEWTKEPAQLLTETTEQYLRRQGAPIRP